MKISVILCSHNPRVHFLNRTLDALKKQSLPYESWELLLIDNSSQEKISERFDISWHPNGLHLEEKKIGKLNAWNLGIAQSKSDLMICVDDDNVLQEDYLENALEIAKKHHFIGVFGGNILPEYEIPLPNWVGDQVWRLTVMELKEDKWSNLREGFETMPAGAGMCVRKCVAEQYLLRCQQQTGALKLDRSGVGLSGYGDMDLAQCAVDIGLGTGLFSKLFLTHLIPAGRLTLDYFVRHAEADATSLMIYRAMRSLPIIKPKKTGIILRIKYLILRLINRITKERYLINQAHFRGLEKGYCVAMEYLKKKHHADESRT